MHMWDCIDCSGFSVADQRRQFITLHFQITHLFSTAEVNSSHIIIQIECTFSWKSNKMGIFKEDFFILCQYSTLPLIETLLAKMGKRTSTEKKKLTPCYDERMYEDSECKNRYMPISSFSSFSSNSIIK